MYFPILINWTSPFPIYGLVSCIFHFIQFFKDPLSANSKEPDQTPCYAAADLGSVLFAYVPQKGRNAYMG